MMVSTDTDKMDGINILEYFFSSILYPILFLSYL